MEPEQPTLYVDLDHSFLTVDVLQEAIIWFFFHDFFFLCRAFLKGNWYKIKTSLSNKFVADADLFPKNPDVVDLIETHKRNNGRVVLATAAHKSIAKSFEKDFDDVLASSDDTNFKGEKKLEGILKNSNEQPFWYVGDSKADIPIFEKAQKAFVVGHLNYDKPHVVHIETKLPPVSFCMDRWWRNIFFLLYPFFVPSTFLMTIKALCVFTLARLCFENLKQVSSMVPGSTRSFPIFIISLIGIVIASLSLPFLEMVFVVPGLINLYDVFPLYQDLTHDEPSYKAEPVLINND